MITARPLKTGTRSVRIGPIGRVRPGAWFACAVALGATICAIFAPWIAPHDPNAIDILHRLRPPVWDADGSWSHVFGTDQLGRDVLSRTIFGARESLAVAAVSIAVGGFIGTSLGLLSGYLGGLVDTTIARAVDATLALPSILLALVLAVTVGPSFWVVTSVIAVVLWAKYARLVRGEVRRLRNQEFVALARTAGASPLRVIAVHLTPNILNGVIVLSALQIGFAIVIEASLSFLGAGVPPPTATWGSMLADGKDYLQTAWWMSVVPGIAMMFVVVAANVVGDVLRERLDPTQRQI